MTTVQADPTPPTPTSRRWRAWLLDGLSSQAARHPGPHGTPPAEHKGHSWWRVMCLTGVDYFSTLGYQPGIAALAAGLLSPFATLVLIALTLFGALPVYRRVAKESPNGEGSIAMLERLLPWWAGKLLVLVLLGFAATDFIITMTLSAADASAHVVENPFAPPLLHGANLWITLVLLAALGAVFLKGFREAIGIAVGLVGDLSGAERRGPGHRGRGMCSPHPVVIGNWWDAMTAQHSSPVAIVGVALLVFPKLALGMSGFETGVAVMPQVQGAATDTDARPAGRIRGTRRLLTTAAADHERLPAAVQPGHHAAHPAGRVRDRRFGQRACAGLPRARIPGRGLRHRLRRLHHRHPLVRRRLGDGGTAQSRTALSAALRHGPGVGPCGASAGAGLPGHRVRHHLLLQRRASTTRAVRTRPVCWC